MLFLVFCLAAAYAISFLLLRIGSYFVDRKGLRKYPSVIPFSGFTNLAYIAFNFTARSKGTTRTEALYAAHQGRPVLRLGPNRLSFAKPEAIKAIYGTGTKCRKGDQYTTMGGTPNILSVVDKHFHSVKRKRLSQAFATTHLLAWEHKVVHNVRELIRQLDSHAEKEEELDFRHWSNLFTVDAIMSIALSLDTKFLESGHSWTKLSMPDGRTKTVDAIDSLRSVNRAAEPFVWSPTLYRTMKRLSTLIPSRRQQWSRAEDWTLYVADCVRQRLSQEEEGKDNDDLFRHLLRDTKGNDLNLDFDELVAETAHLLDAGSDTTSIALTHVMYCLVNHPTKLSKLRDELQRATAGNEPSDVLSYEQVRDLPYLRACLDEAMRLRPSLSPGMQRETPPEGLAVGAEWIPGNTQVSVSPYIAHRDPKVFPDPTSYIPERWLGNGAKDISKYILTFSAGGRICIGKNITYLEQSILLASVVQRYDFSLKSAEWAMPWEEYFNSWPKVLPLQLSRRLVPTV